MGTVSRKPNYSDLDLDFIPHPTTGDVVKKTGDDAIKRSLRNLILTNFYDRPFRHYIGSNVQKLLFELPNPMTANMIKDAVRETVNNYERRINLLGVDVAFDNDNNAYNVSLKYIIINRPEPLTVTIFLERLR